MEKPNLKRRSAKLIRIDANARCQRIYPTEETKRTTDQLKTIGLRLTREQAIHLARVILAAAQNWDVIDITAFRFQRRRIDGTYRITVTSKAGEP